MVQYHPSTDSYLSAFRRKSKLHVKSLTVELLGEEREFEIQKDTRWYSMIRVKIQTKAKARCHSVKTDWLCGKESSYQPLPSYMHRDLAVVLLCLQDLGQGGREKWPLLCMSGSIS